MPKLLSKPIILCHLEEVSNDSTDSCLTNGQKLYAIELIVFVFNVLKNGLNNNLKSLSVKHLYHLLTRHMSEELSAISGNDTCRQLSRSRTRNKINETDDDFTRMALVVNNLLMDFVLCELLTINESKQTIGFYKPSHEWLQSVHKMINESLVVVFKNYLMTQLQRFGRKMIDDIEMRLIRKHSYLFQYLFADHTSYRLIHFIESNANEFEINCIQTSDDCKQTDVYIDVNSDLLSIEKRLNLQLYYKYGHEVNGLTGTVCFSDDMPYILAKVTEIDAKNDIYFEINQNDLKIFDRMVTNWRVDLFIHLHDLVTFDAKLVKLDSMSDSLADKCNERPYSWFVTTITRVRHSASCYLKQL